MSTKQFQQILAIFLLIQLVRAELVLLHVLYRHGDRSPVQAYPKDPNKPEIYWPEGLGQLTKEGKEQEYELGQLLRNYYGDKLQFLDRTFNIKDVYVRSTDKDRTLMSALCMLAGLFPPTKNQTWNQNMTWQPIPVHTESLVDDNLLYLGYDCPEMDRKMAYFKNHDPDYLKTKQENKDLVEYVSKNSGLKPTFDDMLNILDTIYCEKTHNLSQPDWLLKGNTMERLNLLRKKRIAWWFPTHDIAIFKGGNLLKKIYENMWTKMNKHDTLTQRMFIYSGHDTTIAALLKTMKIFNNLVPPYSACVMIELHDNNTVRVLYRNDTFTQEKVTLPIPACKQFCSGCDIFCPLHHFKEIYKDSMPKDVKKLCGIGSKTSFIHNTIGIAVMGCIIALLAIVTVCMCCIYNVKRKQYRYSQVPTDMT